VKLSSHTCRLVTLSYPSADVALTSHVDKEAFIIALSDWNLQLEVMKWEPLNIEAALSHAIKVVAYEESVTDHDDGQAKCQPRNVYTVMDQLDSSDNVTLRRHVEKVQEALEQATQGIAALTAGPWSGCTTP